MNRVLEICHSDDDRYARLNLIPWWDQQRLHNAHVLVVGAGALGNEVLKNLALLGVGNILVVDRDTVETSNLSRAVLFRKADMGRRKVDVVAERICELNNDVRVTRLYGDVIADLGLGVYRYIDVVFACLDNRAARLAVNRACWRVGTPWIDGALDVLMGTVRTYLPPDGACYECTMTERDYELMNLRYACPAGPIEVEQGILPTTPTSAAIVGGFQVQEGIKLLHGMPIPAGTGIFFNGQSRRFLSLTYTRREGCYSHESLDSIEPLNISVQNNTVGELFEVVKSRVTATTSLLLEREIVQSLSCTTCNRREPICRPFDEVIPSAVPCPQCGSNRIPSVLTRLNRGSAAEDVVLCQIGLPPLSIVRMETEEKRYYYELTGDRESILPGWPKHGADA